MTPADEAQDRHAIRELIENWAVWRDALIWDRFRTVWHDDGRMMATWFQGTADEFIAVSREGYGRGVRILHFLGGTSIDIAGARAVAQTKMTISQRAVVEHVLCDVVCTGRFTTSWRSGRAGGAWCCASRSTRRTGSTRSIRPPARPRQHAAGALSGGLSPPRLSAEPDRLCGEDRHARARWSAGRGALCLRGGVAQDRGARVGVIPVNFMLNGSSSRHATASMSIA